MKTIEQRLEDLENKVFGNSYVPSTEDEQYLYDEEFEESEEDRREREEEALFELAANCKCGAWNVVNHKVIHSADCICGAE